jgi:hypothetical protein
MLTTQSNFRLGRRIVPVTVIASVLAGCGVSGTVQATTTARSSATAKSNVAANATSNSSVAPTGGSPPAGGKPPAGGSAPSAPPGGGGSSTPVTGTGAYLLSGGETTKSGSTITASSANQSGVLVEKGGRLTLSKVVVSTTGASSSSNDSSFYGLDSGVLALAGSSVRETGGSVTTTGNGANAVFAYGTGASVTISGTKVKATGQYAHGIMVSGGGTITATDLTVSTTGASGASVATDRGGGTIMVNGGTFTTAGMNSPGLYSTGKLVAHDATFTATGAEAAVVEGSNSIVVTDSSLTGTKNRGVMIYQSFSGDAQGSQGNFTQTGGSLTARSGPLFYVTNTSGVINLKGVKLKALSGTLLEASAGDWGTSGSNGGNVTVNASGQALTDSVVVDNISVASLILTDGSTLTGAINTAASAKQVTLSLDSTSKWTVTADSTLTMLHDGAGISGNAITNIVGNGHTVHYDSSADPSLGGKTYTLVGGGTLTPS